ncbi:MAG TPA: hypothetical protein VF526_15190 [Solirubrobacteraceae bacterium]
MNSAAITSGKPANGAGSADDLVSGFVAAVGDEPPDATDELVGAAFSLGWYLGALCGEHSVVDTLAGDFAGIDEVESINVCLRYVQVGCTKLTKIVEATGQRPFDAEDLAAAIEKSAETGRSAPAHQLHLEAFSILSAVDFRLGRAYRLGRDMLWLTARPPSAEKLKDRLSDMAVAPIVAALDDLSSALPPHAGHSVRASLVEWNGSVEGDGTAKEVQDAVAPDNPRTWALLRRQGQLWRAVLSGEKSAKEMLEIADYLDAAQRLSVRMRSVAGRLLRTFPVLVAAVLVLFVGGIAAMLATNSAATAAAGAGAILTSLGLSWKGIGSALGRLARQVEDPLWGAEIDHAVTRAITLLKPQAARDASHERQRFAAALKQ